MKWDNEQHCSIMKNRKQWSINSFALSNSKLIWQIMEMSQTVSEDLNKFQQQYRATFKECINNDENLKKLS